MLLEKFPEIRTANLLLPLYQEDDIHRQGALLTQGLGDTEDVGEDLTLVVRRTPGVDPSLRDAGLERRGGPALQRIGRLHIIVAVDQDRALRGIPGSTRQHDRGAWRGVDGGLKTGGGKKLSEPFGAAKQIGSMLRLGGDAGKPKKLGQEVDRISGRMRRVHAVEDIKARDHHDPPLSLRYGGGRSCRQ